MSNQHGHRIHWFEIPVTDLDKSAALYAATLGIELKREVCFGVPHAILVADGAGVTGTLKSDPKRVPLRERAALARGARASPEAITVDLARCSFAGERRAGGHADRRTSP